MSSPKSLENVETGIDYISQTIVFRLYLIFKLSLFGVYTLGPKFTRSRTYESFGTKILEFGRALGNRNIQLINFIFAFLRLHFMVSRGCTYELLSDFTTKIKKIDS